MAKSEEDAVTEKKNDPDYTFPDGTEVTFDLEKLTYEEWTNLNDPGRPRKEEEEILAKVAGIDPKKFLANDFKYLDFRRFARAFYRKALAPLDSPN